MPTIAAAAANNVKTSSEIEHVDWSTGGGSGQHNYTSVRYGSGSSQASQSSGDICRICHCESDPQNPLLTPCYCAGSLKYVHQTCLQQWLTASETNACELCKFPFIMHTKIKPFNEWRSLDITGIERRRLCCSLLFHCAAALCVIWSLCVLIERAADDVQRGLIDWPFWTKLAVVTVGMTGGIVFMYIQCKAYLHLCHRWKARNRILLIQNAPEKIHPLSLPSPIVNRSRRCGSVGDIHNSQRDRASIAAGTAVEIGVENVGTSMSNYGGDYARTSGGIDDDMSTDLDESRCAAGSSMHHHHHRHHSLRLSHHMASSSSPSHMLSHADLDADSLTTQASLSSAIGGLQANMLHHHHHHGQNHHQLRANAQPPPLSQVAVAANIECSQSQHNYERDWALDDVVSQISSFRPCPQGSGSMTPFHDSIHNVLEHSEECSSRDLSTGGASSDMGRDHAMQLSSFSGSGEHKAPSIGSGASNAVANGLGGFVYKPHNKRYSNSSIFLENRDILSDNDGIGLSLDMTANDYVKGVGGVGGGGGGFQRQSTHLSSNSSSNNSAGNGSDNTDNDQLDNFMGNNNLKQNRRYSDTKLQINDDGQATANCLDVTDAANVPMLQRHTNNKNHSSGGQVVLDLELPKSPLSTSLVGSVGVGGAVGGSRRSTALQLMHRSLHTVDMGDELLSKHATQQQQQPTTATNGLIVAKQSGDNSRTIFKSLPNLSSSCESLIKK